MGSRGISGKTVLITGGARGLGRRYALRFAKNGADVAIADIDLKSFNEYEAESEQVSADSVEKEIQSYGVSSLGIETDVTDPDAVEEMVASVVDEFSSIDIAVLNAGGGVGSIDTPASEIPFDDFHKTIERNLYGTIYTASAVADYMKNQRAGKLITVSSRAGRTARENGTYAQYGAAKAGVIMYTKYLAQDLSRYGINVNCIAPGPIKTGRIQESMAELYAHLGEDGETVEAPIVDEIPLGRLGMPEDCADAVEYLASKQSDFITGAVVPIDGGQTRF